MQRVQVHSSLSGNTSGVDDKEGVWHVTLPLIVALSLKAGSYVVAVYHFTRLPLEYCMQFWHDTIERMWRLWGRC